MNTPLLIVWPEYPPAIGGIQVHGFEFARFLRAQAIPFVLITRAPASPESACEAAKFDAQAGISPLRVLPRTDFSSALHLLADCVTNLRPVAMFSSQIAYAPAVAGRLRVVCRSAGNDVLRPWVGPAVVSFAELHRLPEVEQRERLQANTEWVRHAAAACDEVVCNSQWTASQLRRLLDVPTTVIRGGVDTEHFKPLDRGRLRAYLSWAGSSLLVVLAARHVLKKGIDVALTAFARLDRDAKLVIAGRGPETPRLMKITRLLGITERVRFVGPMPHQAMPWLLGIADVVLAPSQSVYDGRRFGIDHETMCRVACESAACGTPVVASNCGGIPEIVLDGRTGLLVRPGDPDELASAIRQLIDAPDLRLRMSAVAREWAVSGLSFDQVNRATLSRILQ
jgi:phosphatidyl-myo-inositol dimannoside synthase